MPIYWVNIDVRFKEPMKLEDEEENSNEKIYGYLQIIGATFPNEQLLKDNIFVLVCEDFDVDNVEIIYESVGVIPLHKVKKEIYGDKDIGRLLRSEPKNDGIWYKTGRGFYTDEDSLRVRRDMACHVRCLPQRRETAHYSDAIQ